MASIGFRLNGSCHSGQPSSTKKRIPSGVNCLRNAILSLAAQALRQAKCSRIFLITAIQRRNGQGVIHFRLSAAVIAVILCPRVLDLSLVAIFHPRFCFWAVLF